MHTSQEIAGVVYVRLRWRNSLEHFLALIHPMRLLESKRSGFLKLGETLSGDACDSNDICAIECADQLVHEVYGCREMKTPHGFRVCCLVEAVHCSLSQLVCHSPTNDNDR